VTGFTVPVDEPAALAERLARLLGDPVLRQRMSMQALAAARDYAWDKIAARLMAVYTDVLGSSGLEG
jgi:glycosyltransferase involved in cell wall biosynthesis